MSITKHVQGSLQKAANSKYDASFVMSSAAPDRVDDTFDIGAYASVIGKKLLALFGHDSDKPIGYWENIRVEGKKLIGDISLAPTNLGNMLRALIDHGTPLMSSVSFAPKDYDVNDAGGLHFKTVDWLECSVVSVGCHQDAVMRYAKEFNVEIRPSDLNAAVSGENEGLSNEAILRAKAAVLSANRTLRK